MFNIGDEYQSYDDVCPRYDDDHCSKEIEDSTSNQLIITEKEEKQRNKKDGSPEIKSSSSHNDLKGCEVIDKNIEDEKRSSTQKINHKELECVESFNSTTSVVLNWDIRETKTITECENESESGINLKQNSNLESDQEEIMLSAKELLSKTTHCREPSFGISRSVQAININLESSEKYDQLCRDIEEKQSEINSLKSTVNKLEERIKDLEGDLNNDRLYKRYFALLKVFDQCQIAWKNENENLRSLLFNDYVDLNKDTKQAPNIITLDTVKTMIDECFKEQDVRQYNYDTIKESIYSSLTFSLTGEINEENHESENKKTDKNDENTPFKAKEDQNMNYSNDQNKNYESNNDRRSCKSNKSDVSSTPKTPYKSESKAEIVFDQKEKSKNLFNSDLTKNSNVENQQNVINHFNIKTSECKTKIYNSSNTAENNVELCNANNEAFTKLVHSPHSIKEILSQNDENVLHTQNCSSLNKSPTRKNLRN